MCICVCACVCVFACLYMINGSIAFCESDSMHIEIIYKLNIDIPL